MYIINLGPEMLYGHNISFGKHSDEFNRKQRQKTSETETVNPRVDLTEQTAPASVTLRLSMPVSSPGTEASEKVNPRLI